MMFGVNDLITLSDDKKYGVLAKVLHNENNYYYLVEVDESEEDLVDNAMIVKDSPDGSVEVVEEEEELEIVQPLLAKSIQINYDIKEEDIQEAIAKLEEQQ